MIGKKILVYNFGIALLSLAFLLPSAEGNVMFFAGKRPENLGVQNGKLALCPQSPNCVSSFDSGDRFISPLSYEGSGEGFWNTVKEVIKKMRGAQIIKEEGSYMHVEFSSSFFGFVDDVELLLDADNNVLHVRSASRLGYYDFGVNRKRVEEIRKRALGITNQDK